MGCKKLQLEYYETLRTSQTNSMRFVNAIDKKNSYTYDDNVSNIFIIKTIIYALIDLISLRILFSINKKSIQSYSYDACEFRKNSFLTTEITKKTQKPANSAKFSSLSCPQRKMQSLRTSQTINGLTPLSFAKSTSIIKISISCYYGLRYYNSKLGRWINRDPIGEQGGLNIYAFVTNDAVNRWDYLGMKKFTTSIKRKLGPYDIALFWLKYEIDATWTIDIQEGKSKSDCPSKIPTGFSPFYNVDPYSEYYGWNKGVGVGVRFTYGVKGSNWEMSINNSIGVSSRGKNWIKSLLSASIDVEHGETNNAGFQYWLKKVNYKGFQAECVCVNYKLDLTHKLTGGIYHGRIGSAIAIIAVMSTGVDKITALGYALVETGRKIIPQLITQ